MEISECVFFFFFEFWWKKYPNILINVTVCYVERMTIYILFKCYLQYKQCLNNISLLKQGIKQRKILPYINMVLNI